MTPPIRRVVTGHEDGRSVIVQDDRVATDAIGLTDFWTTAQVPALLGAAGEPECPVRLEPPPGGTRFRFFEVAPQSTFTSAEQAEALFAAAFTALDAAHCRVDTRRHPMMHQSRTIDYVVVLRGTVTLLLDEGEVSLQPFDVVVQRGTNHAWTNPGTEPALLMAVLVDAQP